jgi:Tol biopolymer transport system component
VRPPYIGVAVGLVWIFSALIAHERIGYYPPRKSKPALMMLAAAVGIIGWIVTSDVPKRALAGTTVGALVAAALVPFMLTAWVPGVAGLKTHAIPGSPSLVITAAPEGNWDLWLIHGGQPDSYTRLTHTPEAEWAGGRSLSPDGRQVVYSRTVGGHHALWMMRLDGSGNPAGTTVLLDPGSDVEDPAWSPDGSTIAYTESTSIGSGIWLMDADGTDQRAAIEVGGHPYAPEWSPDGTKILFTARVGTDTDVFAANVDGTQMRDLTPGTLSHDVSKGWTPDGQPLFLSNRSNTGGTFLYVMSPDGSDVRLCVIL